MRRTLVIIIVAAMASVMVVAGPAVRAVRGAPSPFNPSPGADQPAQVDFNGDGFDDLAVGGPNEGVGGQVRAGAVNILYGSADGLTGTNQLLTQASPEAGDQFGAAVAKGDFNNDAITDLAVGAPGETLAGDVGAGAVNVFYGSSSGLPTTSQVLMQANPEAGDQFGAAVEAGTYDDGPGADLAVGAPGENHGAGAVNVFYRRNVLPGTSQVLQQASPEGGDRFGAALVAAFSCGLATLVVGAPGEDVGTVNAAGAVNVFCAGDFSLPGTSQVLLQPNPEAGDQFGFALAAGFFDASGGYDIAVGAPTEDVGAQQDAGMVTVFHPRSGNLSSFIQTFVQGPGIGGAAEAGDRFGASLGAGFLDSIQGGTPWELVVGAPGEDLGATANVGAVNVLYGTNDGLVGRGQVLVQGSPGVADTAESDDSFGGSQARGFYWNDFNGDGLADLAVGAAREDLGAITNAGAVNILYGSTTSFPATGGQFFTQDSAGMGGSAEPGDALASALD